MSPDMEMPVNLTWGNTFIPSWDKRIIVNADSPNEVSGMNADINCSLREILWKNNLAK